MAIRRHTIEYWLIVSGLLLSFLYFGFRSLVWDSFLWIAIVPALCLLYVLTIGPRFWGYRLNGLDKAIFLYLLYGIGLIGLATLFLGYGKTSAVTAIVHFYAPTGLYFVARSYTNNSPRNALRVTRIIWVMAIVLVVDVFAEYYVIKVLQSPLSIPWVRLDVQDYPFITPELQDRFQLGAVGSILSSSKLTGTMVVAFFAFTLPFFYARKRLPAGWARSWQFNPVVNFVVLVALVFSAFVVQNKSAILVGIVVLLIGVVSTRSPRRMALVGVLVIIGVVFYYDTLLVSVRGIFITPIHYSTSKVDLDTTLFQYVVNLDVVYRGYLNTDLQNLFFGNLVNPGGLQSALTTGPFASELRGLALPASFGVGWTLIVVASLILMFRYSFALIRTQSLKLFGFAFVAFLFVYVTDIHYTTVIRHGPIELFLVMAATLSSLREVVRSSGADQEESMSDRVQEAPAL